MANQTEKQRHGFVSFWIWLNIVIDGFFSIFFIATVYDRLNLLFSSHPSVSDAIGVVVGSCSPALVVICMVVSLIMILKWKKLGFTIYLIASIAALAFSIIALITTESYPEFWDIIIYSVISLVALYGVLQIKKNGVSCWTILE